MHLRAHTQDLSILQSISSKASHSIAVSLGVISICIPPSIELYIKQIGGGGLIKEEKLKYRKYFGIDNDYDDYWYYNKHWIKELSYKNRIRYLDFKTYMHEAVLTKVDRTSMSVSLEARVPLLSRELIEFMFTLPSDLIFKDNKLKGLAKYAYKDILPEAILSKEKQGFSIPTNYFKSKKSINLHTLEKCYSTFLYDLESEH